jgi:hypothetical protein
MAKNISVALAKSVAAEISRLDALLPSLADFIPMVQEEVNELHTLRSMDPVAHATRAVLFALSSPQNRFDCNVIAARRLHAGLAEFSDVESIYQALAADKCGTVSSGGVARAIFHSLSWLRGGFTYNAETLRGLQRDRVIMGAGMKVTAMAAHLFDPSDRVFTLDTHMYRGILKTVLDIDGTWTAGNPAYSIMETALLEWCDTRFAGTDPFVLQWAMWCVFRGSFDSHLAIFA